MFLSNGKCSDSFIFETFPSPFGTKSFMASVESFEQFGQTGRGWNGGGNALTNEKTTEVNLFFRTTMMPIKIYVIINSKI